MSQDIDRFIKMDDATLLKKLEELLSYPDGLSYEDQLLLIEIKKRFSARIADRQEPNRSCKSLPVIDG